MRQWGELGRNTKQTAISTEVYGLWDAAVCLSHRLEGRASADLRHRPASDHPQRSHTTACNTQRENGREVAVKPIEVEKHTPVQTLSENTGAQAHRQTHTSMRGLIAFREKMFLVETEDTDFAPLFNNARVNSVVS